MNAKNQLAEDLLDLFAKPEPVTYAAEQDKIRANLERLRRERLEREAAQSKPDTGSRRAAHDRQPAKG